MSTRINIIYWIVRCIRIPIPRQGIARLRNDRVGLDEARKVGVVVAGVVEIDPELFLADLARPAPGGCLLPVGGQRTTERHALAERSGAPPLGHEV
jgi:hypothetical protein